MKKRERGSRGERHKGRGVLRASVSGQWAAPGGPCQWTPGPLQTAVSLVLPVPLTFIHPLHPPCMYPRVLCEPLPTFQHLLDVRGSNPAHMLRLGRVLRACKQALQLLDTSYAERSARMDACSEDATDDGGLEEGLQEQMLGMPRE